MSSSEDTNKKEAEDKDLIDKDTLIYLGAGAGVLGLVGVIAMVGMNWMKEQDQEKRRIAIQKQQLDMAQRALQNRRQKPPEAGGWPNPIPNNTVSPIMELPSEDNREDGEQFVGQYPSATSYNVNEQKFLVSDDPLQQPNYPVINPNATPQQIGNKISRVMSLDGVNVPTQQQQQQPQPRTQGDDEDFSDLFN